MHKEVFSDNSIFENGHPPLFEPENHRKYNAKYYYKRDEDKSKKEHMDEPKRSPEAQKAHDTFIRGLQSIQQQEYLNAGHTKDDKEKAEWERLVTQRACASSSRRYNQYLERRVKFMKKSPEYFQNTKIENKVVGLDAEEGKSVKGNSLPLPPIRKQTAELLLRPAELDFSINQFFFIIFTIGVCLYNLAVQIDTITTICHDPYLCALGTSGFPLVAPTSDQRINTSAISTVSVSFTRTGSYEITPSCRFGDAGCTTPGYIIQWPYTLSAVGSVALSPGLTARCKITADPVWDPFTNNLRLEYVDCSDANGNLPANIPFLEPPADRATGGGDTAFTFDTVYYRRNRDLTARCIRDNLGLPSSAAAANLTWLQRSRLSECARHGSLDLLAPERSLCQCDPKGLWYQWPLPLFYFEEQPLRICQGTSFLCDRDADCGVGGRCEESFPGQRPLNQSSRYGCYFVVEKGSIVQLSVEVHQCGYSESALTGSRGSKLQNSAHTVLSKQGALIVILLVKEGWVLSAFFVVAGLLLVCGLALLVVLVLVMPLVALASTGRKKRLLRIRLWVLYDTVVAPMVMGQFGQLNVLWSMMKNFSTVARVFKLCWSMRHGEVNVSILDMDLKLTTVANIIFNLVLLITLGGNLYGNIVASMLSSLILLLYTMNAEKVSLNYIRYALKDLNENRLGKFDFALLLIKFMEDFLEDDIHYNWVQHLTGSPEDLELRLPVETESKAEDLGNQGVCQRFLGIQPKESWEADLFHLPELPLQKALKFGHDGLGLYGPAEEQALEAVLQPGDKEKLRRTVNGFVAEVVDGNESVQGERIVLGDPYPPPSGSAYIGAHNQPMPFNPLNTPSPSFPVLLPRQYDIPAFDPPPYGVAYQPNPAPTLSSAIVNQNTVPPAAAPQPSHVPPRMPPPPPVGPPPHPSPPIAPLSTAPPPPPGRPPPPPP